MTTPKGMKCLPRTLLSGEQVLLYTDATRIILQLRRQVPTAEDLLAPSFKVAISLNPLEAAQLAEDLLGAALAQLYAQERATTGGGERSQEKETRDG